METENKRHIDGGEVPKETRETLLALSQGKVSPETRRELERVLQAHPYFSLGHAFMIKHFGSALESAELEEHKRLAALGCGDRRALMGLAGPEALDYRLFYPPEEKPQRMSTSRVLEIYDSHFSTGEESVESSVIEKLIFNPPVEYSEILAREDASAIASDNEEQDETSRRIDNFLKTGRQPAMPADAPAAPPVHATDPQDSMPASTYHGDMPSATTSPTPEPSRPSSETSEVSKSDLLSESLAKFYIRQGRYQQAFEIISSLNLKYPKKSIYFADQMRFLQKLMRLEDFRRSVSPRKQQ